MSPSAAKPPAEPLLTGVVIHWRDEEALARLVQAWPRDPRFELLVIDNGSSGSGGVSDLPPGVRGRVLRPGGNLGFAGAANRGAAASRGGSILLLNPDATPAPGALEAVLEGLAVHREAAGLAPRLEGDGGATQHRWQLGRLPSPGRLVLEGLFLPARGGPDREPPAGTPIEQPAAAALVLRRPVWDRLGGMDPRFYPAWFEDVDLARRLAAAGDEIVYWPAAHFHHGLGSTVPQLGFDRFLWIYYRNLERYLAKYHGRLWTVASRAVLPLGMLLRLALLPVRSPRRATGRAQATRALLGVAAGALTGWRVPRRSARATAPGSPSGEETQT